jgi:hypothetical protein
MAIKDLFNIKIGKKGLQCGKSDNSTATDTVNTATTKKSNIKSTMAIVVGVVMFFILGGAGAILFLMTAPPKTETPNVVLDFGVIGQENIAQQQAGDMAGNVAVDPNVVVDPLAPPALKDMPVQEPVTIAQPQPVQTINQAGKAVEKPKEPAPTFATAPPQIGIGAGVKMVERDPLKAEFLRRFQNRDGGNRANVGAGQHRNIESMKNELTAGLTFPSTDIVIPQPHAVANVREKETPNIIVSGIFGISGAKTAITNKGALSVGSSINGYIVEKIDRASITLHSSRDNSRFVVNVTAGDAIKDDSPAQIGAELTDQPTTPMVFGQPMLNMR